MSSLQKIVNEKIKELTDKYKIHEGSFEEKEKKIDKIYELYEKNIKYDTISEKDINELEKKKKIIKDSPVYKFCLLRSLKKIIESYEIDDPEYVDYPDKNDKRFEEKIYEKEEFNMFEIPKESKGLFNVCENKDFEISAHQLFLKNYLTKETPYNGALLFHGVGVGKTCSAITISENFRDLYASREKRIIILCSKNIKIGWKKTIFNPDLGENQCTGNIFLKRNIKTRREVNRLVRDYYEIMAYLSFANYVKRLVKIKGKKYYKESPEERERLVINEIFSNRLLIIDEAHNLRDDGEKDIKDSVDMIEKVIKYSDNLKIVLLSATPMYNRSTEIVRLLNMLLTNDKKELLNKDKIFLKDGSFKKGGATILKEASRGYVSYVRGEDPSSFPIRLYPSYTEEFLNYDSSIEDNRSLSMILDKDNYPENDMKENKIEGSKKLSFLETFGSKLKSGSHQEIIYERLEKEILESSSEEEMLPSIKDINRIIRAGNMSLGVNLLVQLTKKVAAVLDDDFDVEIIETHHNKKVDAPSGTAIMLGNAAADGRQVALSEVRDNGRDGITGVRNKGDIGFVSVRGGDVVGEHDVLFAAAGERIVLRHVATDRAIFVRGALKAVEWGIRQAPGEYSMEDVLGL